MVRNRTLERLCGDDDHRFRIWRGAYYQLTGESTISMINKTPAAIIPALKIRNAHSIVLNSESQRICTPPPDRHATVE